METKIIRDYILYLVKNCDLSVTLHPMSDESMITCSSLMDFNIHDNPYCSHIKSMPSGHLRCWAQQKKVFRQCSKENVSYCGVCYAGVKEYVYPISDGNKAIGFISVSGYASDDKEKRIAFMSEQFGASADLLAKEYRKLKTDMPDKDKVDTLILPLCKMLELAYLKEVKESKPISLNEQICRYIQRNYALALTTETICERFSCSKSYFSHNFKEYTGKTFREYLIDIRLSYAKQLLEYSTLSITQISFSVGFNDSNYFSNVFKQKIGISPRLYRKNKTESDN